MTPGYIADTAGTTALSVALPMYLFIYLFIYFPFRATPAAHGCTRARSRVRAAAAGLHHSHGNAGSEPHLRPTMQLVAKPDP